jgi:hypothetical protein
MSAKAPPPVPQPPTAEELEQKRRLALIQRNERGRGSTLLSGLLGSGLLGEQPVINQTRLGS